MKKKVFLKKNHIGLYDVIKKCKINGSNDSSIKNPIPTNIQPLLKNTKIKTIFTTGKKAYNLYQKMIFPLTKIHAIYLPSTSPANCQKNIEDILYNSYKQIKEITEKD